jgi:hypothetical protein
MFFELHARRFVGRRRTTVLVAWAFHSPGRVGQCGRAVPNRSAFEHPAQLHAACIFTTA